MQKRRKEIMKIIVPEDLREYLKSRGNILSIGMFYVPHG